MMGIGAAANAVTLSEVLSASNITATGYVAASYFYSNESNALHQFDFGHSDFHLDQAGLTLAYQPKEGFGALVDLIGGEDARVVNFAESGDTEQVNVKQAFVQYAGGGWTIMAGKFVTLAGAEVIAPTGNTNYSRSLLFYGEPLTHTGVRANYAINDTFGVTFGVNNGWNYTNTGGYGSKTAELGVSFAPSKAFSLTAQGYVGKDPVIGTTRTLVDLVGTWNATDALSVVVSYDSFMQDNPLPSGQDVKWNGIAGYVNFKINDQWRLSARAEWIDDKDGIYTGVSDETVQELTLTFGYAPVENFELRLEGRYDKTDDKLLPKYKGTGATDTQSEFAIQGVYKFGI